MRVPRTAIPPRTRRSASGLLLVAALLGGPVGRAAEVRNLATAPAGGVVSKIPALADPAMTWELYLPKGYDPAKRWPVLFLFDPRGRGSFPLELFREAADELGWMLASSNDTRSDDATADNSRAVNALVADATRRLPVDERRIYAAGFSGGAVLAWVMALRTDWLAGAISVGGRPAPEHAALAPRCPVWVGAGIEDFNALPTVKLGRIAAKAGVPHRLASYPGGHAWCGKGPARDALVWHELLAARGGKSSLPPDRIEALREEELATARALAERGPPLEAARRLREVAELFRGRPEAEGLFSRAKSLEETPAARAARKEEKAGEALEERSGSRLVAALRLLHEETPPPPAGRLLRELEVDDLLRKAAADGVTSHAARRALSSIRAQLGSYEARALFRAGDWHRAVPAMAVAVATAPESAVLRYDLACAQARSGALDAALASLSEALDRGLPQPLFMETDEDLATLRGRPEFAKLLERARALAAAPTTP